MEQLAIETERLILRPMTMSDVDDLLEYQSLPEIFQYIQWPVSSRGEARHAPGGGI